MTPLRDRADEAVAAIIEDLSDRRGFRQQLHGLDDETDLQIRDTWRTIVLDVLQAAVDAKAAELGDWKRMWLELRNSVEGQRYAAVEAERDSIAKPDAVRDLSAFADDAVCDEVYGCCAICGESVTYEIVRAPHAPSCVLARARSERQP